MEDNSVNKRIAGYRKLAGFTQSQAADLLGMKRNTYARMEKYGKPSPDMLKKISELYRVSVSTLLYGRDESSTYIPPSVIPPLSLEEPKNNDVLPLSMMETNAIRIFRNLSRPEQQKIVDVINDIYRNSKRK